MQSYISREQDYALRISARLASLNPGEHISVRELSKQLFVSKNFAARIVHKLILKGIFSSRQGNKGGVFLNLPANEINLLQILDAIGFKMKFNQCLHEEIDCQLMEFCKFHSFFHLQESSIHKSLQDKKLSDFVIK